MDFRETLFVLHDTGNANTGWLQIAPLAFHAFLEGCVDIVAVNINESKDLPTCLTDVLSVLIPELVVHYRMPKWRTLGYGFGAGTLLSCLLKFPDAVLSKCAGVNTFLNLDFPGGVFLGDRFVRSIRGFLERRRDMQFCFLWKDGNGRDRSQSDSRFFTSYQTVSGLDLPRQVLHVELPLDAFLMKNLKRPKAAEILKFQPQILAGLVALVTVNSIMDLQLIEGYLERRPQTDEVGDLLATISHFHKGEDSVEDPQLTSLRRRRTNALIECVLEETKLL